MSIQELILNSLTSLQSDGDLRGAIQHIINTGVHTTGNESWHPNTDIIDTNEFLYIYMELPGVSDDSISVDCCNNKLSVSGNKINPYTSPSLSKREIVYGKFNRELLIPISVTSQ